MFTLMFLVIFKDIFPTKRSSHITVMFQISKSKKCNILTILSWTIPLKTRASSKIYI